MVGRRCVASAAAFAVAVPLALLASPASAARHTARPYDFDGDGHQQLVVGAPGLDLIGYEAAGGVLAFPPGPTLGHDHQLISQSTPGVAGSSEDDDYFGDTVTSADFDRDGYADLAVGHPYESSGSKRGVGAVTVLYGSPSGLTGKRSKQFFEPGGKVTDAKFGRSLAVGDLNGDNYPDLVVGAVEVTSQQEFAASGTVAVLYSGKKGVSTSHSTRVHGVRGDKAQDIDFGVALATGDVDDDGRADLVVASRGEGFEDGDGIPGSITVCRGAKKRVGHCTRTVRSEDLLEADALAVANVSGSARPEIVVAAGGNINYRAGRYEIPGHLAVLEMSGHGSRLRFGTSVFAAADAHVPGVTADDSNEFGWTLAAADWDGDGYTDLAVGDRLGRVGEVRAGRVFLVRGGRDGLSRSGNTAFDLSTPGVPGDVVDLGEFSSAISLVDRNADGHPDLTVASSGNKTTPTVTAMLGTGHGFTTAGAQTVDETDLGFPAGSDILLGDSLGG